MQSILTKDMASNFRWHMDEDALHTLTLNQLFDSEVREHHFSRLMSEYGSPSRGHAASMTTKRIGYMAALIIYARIKHNVLTNPKECRFITIADESSKAGWLPVYSFPLKETASSETVLEWIVKELYCATLVPLVNLFAKEKGISRVVLFENIFTYIKWIFLTHLQDPATFQQLLDIPAVEFGTKQHPLSLYVSSDEGTRKTCCLYYQTAGAIKACKTCPL
ncbi:(2Fe-2S)-binding protein [Paenisporosarcina quisquiliarum]|uniref:(2Fe-2S)-binding protein n=1 Tax=Paenisporosarcina quisquiliarum TaxID=365346 RepID=A0A9X3LF36_9BACL|nr:(2Fe-2S)-binding protein [Paenisporosarcina quisquiliarum]MCZ8536855.1 (2Fe-2S)-binding protein [Paenisporosarcina quisquiliarum]